MAEYAIEIRDLRKSFGNVAAVDGISLSVSSGELFGIIGPDGAGKTTLLRMMTTLTDPDSGEGTVGGLDIRKDYRRIRSNVGYMPGRFSLYQDLTVKENIDFFASVFGTDLQTNYDLIKDIYCRLEPFAGRKAGKLSGGMKQKLALCCALIHSPSILFLDEPTTGVDPSSRREFWEMLSRLKNDFGITMVVSTAYMDEASRCDRVAMMDHGHFLKTGTVPQIISGFDRRLFAVRSDNMYGLLSDVRSIDGVEACYTFGGEHHVRLSPDCLLSPEDMTSTLTSLGQRGVSVRTCTPDMEDCFIAESYGKE